MRNLDNEYKTIFKANKEKLEAFQKNSSHIEVSYKIVLNSAKNLNWITKFGQLIQNNLSGKVRQTSKLHRPLLAILEFPIKCL